MNQAVFFIYGLIILVWLIFLTWLAWQNKSHYRRLTAGVTKKELKEVLEKLITTVAEADKKNKNLANVLEELRHDQIFHLQKLGMVRYNPFAETGGDQSFCLVLLDGQENGLVISSLHSRDQTRVYAKPVKKGKAVGYEFSEEEKRAIKEARKSK